MMRRSAFLAALLLCPCILAAGQADSHGENDKATEAQAVVIDINQASAGDFAKLPGIGPKLAKRIVAYRDKHGPFRRVEDLLAIRGIGMKKWKALRPHLRVGQGVEGRPGRQKAGDWGVAHEVWDRKLGPWC